jgi:protein-L-isoaspartate O-methyltransferase
MDRIGEAFRTVRRSDFVTAGLREEADVDAPLPIGFGQTISQPTTVKLMLSWLDAMPGDEVLDVRSGSGSAIGYTRSAYYDRAASISACSRASASCNPITSSALTHARASCSSEASLEG